MLLEFSCSNHKSIGEKVVFSLIAGKDTENHEMIKKINNINVLKSAVIYGANGSGKSTLVDAIRFVKELVLNSINYQPGDMIEQNAHKLKGIGETSNYSIQFIVKNIRYAFGFSLINRIICDEYLYFFPNGRQTKIYERNNAGFSAGDKFKGKFDLCNDVLKENRLFLSCAANFSSVSEVEDVFSFFRNDIVIYYPSAIRNWMSYSLNSMYSDKAMKDSVISFLKNLGTGIEDIKIDIEDKSINADDLPSFFSVEARNKLAHVSSKSIKADVVYNGFSVNLMNEESTGIKKLFEFICPFLDIIVKNKVLICDELETNLHESIVCSLINTFKGTPESLSQLILITHDTSILDLKNFRRDQIWFTELNENRSTDLYSLSEIKNVRKDENVSKGYISGRYGAIPMLNENFAITIKKLQDEKKLQNEVKTNE